MEIRPAQKNDIRKLAELWAHAFPGERTVEQRIRQLDAGGVYGGVETAWLAHADGHVAGAFRAYRLRQHMHGAVMPMMGLAAVAVASHARRQGLGGDLCRTALRHARERGDVLSVLYPFRPSFYEALGWGLTGSLHSYTFRPESLPVSHDGPRVHLTHDNEALARCYDRVAAKSNGLIERSGRIWRQHLEWPDVHSFALMRGDECAGYMIVHYGRPAAGDERVFTIRELLSVDDDARAELLSWVSLQRDAWRLVRYDALPGERFDLLLMEPRMPGAPPYRDLWARVAHVIRGPMLRVLNVASALRARRDWEGEEGFGVRVVVEDRELPENSEAVSVVFTAEGVRVGAALPARGGGASPSRGGAAMPTLEVGIGVFSQIYSGELSVLEAVGLGKAAVSGDGEMIDRVFRARGEFRILDEF